MSNGEITADIERFIQDYINSVEQLEILLLMAGTPQKEWSALEISKKMYRQPDSVAARLEDLRDHGLLSVRQEYGATTQEEHQKTHLLYCYASNSQDRLVQGLERAYQVRKDAVIQLIFNRPQERPQNNLRAFSDAFRIRRDK